MRVSDDRKDAPDIFQIIEELKSKYDDVYWITIGDTVYIYKPLGRRDEIEIHELELSDLRKQNEVVNRTLLYPHIDANSLKAGVFDKLYSTILKNSYMDEDVQARMNVTIYFRNEMQKLNNQVNAIISEAFPKYSIEEIENWGVERTAKYLAYAEWKLQNFYGATFNYDPVEEMQKNLSGSAVPEQEQNPQSVDKTVPAKKANTKKKYSREQIEALKRQFPEIDWEHDAVAEEGMAALNQHVDTTPVALRPIGQN